VEPGQQKAEQGDTDSKGILLKKIDFYAFQRSRGCCKPAGVVMRRNDNLIQFAFDYYVEHPVADT